MKLGVLPRRRVTGTNITVAAVSRFASSLLGVLFCVRCAVKVIQSLVKFATIIRLNISSKIATPCLIKSDRLHVAFNLPWFKTWIVFTRSLEKIERVSFKLSSLRSMKGHSQSIRSKGGLGTGQARLKHIDGRVFVDAEAR